MRTSRVSISTWATKKQMFSDQQEAKARRDNDQDLKGGRLEHLLTDAVLLKQVIAKKAFDLELSRTQTATEKVSLSRVLLLEVALSNALGPEALGISEAPYPSIRLNRKSRDLHHLGLQVSHL